MDSPPALLTCAVLFTILTVAAASHPASSFSAFAGQYGNNVFDNGRIIDITHEYRRTMPAFMSKRGMPSVVSELYSMRKNSSTNNSFLKVAVHSGTHADAPSHVYLKYLDQGVDADAFNLEVLNGRGTVVDVPRDTNITAEVLKSLKIPRGVQRVLFRTLNTDRHLMYKKEFESSYVGFTKDGAQWLVDNTDIKLIGLDYLSVARMADLIPTHLIFLAKADIIPVEGLNLDDVKPGNYMINCLPLRLHADGAPTRCILTKD